MIARGVAIVRPLARRVGAARAFSGHDAAEAAAEMVTWKKYSFAAVASTGLFALYIAYIEHQHSKHPHEHEKAAYTHLKIRNKPYPHRALRLDLDTCGRRIHFVRVDRWKCPDCNLFDFKCWAACKEKLAAKNN